MGAMSKAHPARNARKHEMRTITPRVRAIAQTHDADALLAVIAEEAGVALARLPSARLGYLAALLRTGTHKRALAAVKMPNAEYNRHFQDQRFRKLVRGVRAILDEVRVDVIHDLVHERAGKSDKVLMFAAERLDPRYAPPHVTARQGDKTNIQAVQINVMLPNGRPVGDHGGVGNEKQKIYGGFFERMLGCEPNNNPTEPTDPDNATDPTGSATGTTDDGDATDGGGG